MVSSDSSTRLAMGAAVILVMLLLVTVAAPSLAIWHRSQIAEHLAQQVADNNDSAVKVPLRQLAQLGDAGLERLVAAAASQRATVSSIARQIIDEKMAAWQLYAASGSQTIDPKFVIGLNTLAASLVVHVDNFGPTGKQWVERLALVMIDLADILPVVQSAALLSDCSEIFAAVPPRGPIVRTVTSLGTATQSDSLTVLETPPFQLEPLTRASDSSLEILARLQPRRSRALQGHIAQEPTRQDAALVQPPQRAASDLRWVPRPAAKVEQLTSPPPVTTLNRIEATPNRRAEPVSNGVRDVPTPAEMQNQAVLLRQVSTDELLDRLDSAGFFQAGIVRKVLADRGFSDVDVELMRRLVSPDAEYRLRLVDDVSMLPAARARRLLGWLLGDPSADVRLRALTALATTHSSDLTELARELALHDEDPRVSELASRLLRQVR